MESQEKCEYEGDSGNNCEEQCEEESEEESEEKCREECKKKCQFHSEICGNHVLFRDRKGCVVLNELNEDFGHIFGANTVITERDLICMRSEISLDADGLICSNHQFKLGRGYRPSLLCKYREHPTDSRTRGSKVTWELYMYVKALDTNFVLGSLICKVCQKKLRKVMSSEDDDNSDDPDFVPEIPFLDDEEKLVRRTQLDSLTSTLGVDRIRFQLTSHIEDVDIKSLNYLRRSHQGMQNRLTDEFCRLVAPGQEAKMKEFLLKETNDIDPLITHLKEAFDKCATAKARRAVLTLVPKTYSKPEVSKLFDCSLYEVEKSRAVLKLYGTCGEKPKPDRVYSRLSVEKARHFIDFLFSTALLQEVAYGTTTLKFESGDKLTISNTILNCIHEHAMKEYQIHCKEINYDGLGRSSLLKILKKMKPHVRKKLAGIDTFVVEGIEAFEVNELILFLFYIYFILQIFLLVFKIVLEIVKQCWKH